MHSYDTKIIDFGGCVEVRHYASKIRLLDDSEKEERRLKRQVKADPVPELNPFSGLLEVFEPWTDPEAVEFFKNRSIVSSVNRTKQAVYSICRSNAWEWFATLTFDPEKVDSADYDACVAALHDWLKYIRKNYAPGLKYVLVPELHSDGRKYHFHGLFSSTGNLVFTYSGIIRNGVKIYNLKQYKKGFSTFSAVRDSRKAASYITKYITKDLCSVIKGRKRYWCSRNLDSPSVVLADFHDDEIPFLLDSFGELAYAKKLDQQYFDFSSDETVRLNYCKIYQVDKGVVL